MVREVSGVEVTEHRSDGDYQFRTLDLLEDVRVTDGSNVNLEATAESPAMMTSKSTTYTTVSRIILINSCLSHRRGIDRELSLVQEFSQFLLNTVTNGTSINEDGNITASLLDQFVNALDCGSLNIWVILGWLAVEVGAQPRGRDPLIRQIGGKGKVHRPFLRKSDPTSKTVSSDKGIRTYGNKTVSQHTVDLDIGVLRAGEVSLRDGELFGGFLVRIKPAHTTSKDTGWTLINVKSTNLPSPRVWCNMGLVLSCNVFGVPAMWMTGTCSEKAGRVNGRWAQRREQVS